MPIKDIRSLYDIGDCTGSGSFGDVFQARDKRTRTQVALKRLKYNASLKKEAYPIDLEHKNIISAFECVCASHEGMLRDYLVMEWLDGYTLKEVLSNRTCMSAPEALSMFTHCAEALDYAHRVHEKQIVHRDIKPSNLFLCRDGTLKLTDFSIATEKNGTATADGGVAGTYGYIAPELFYSAVNRGDEESDIFSFGVCLYEALTGECPIRGLADLSPIEILLWAKSFSEEKIDFSNTVFADNPQLIKFIKQCLAWRRSRRFSFREVIRYYTAKVWNNKSPRDDELRSESVRTVNAELKNLIRSHFSFGRYYRFESFAEVLENLKILAMSYEEANSPASTVTDDSKSRTAGDPPSGSAFGNFSFPGYKVIEVHEDRVLAVRYDDEKTPPVTLIRISSPGSVDFIESLCPLAATYGLTEFIEIPEGIVANESDDSKWFVAANPKPCTPARNFLTHGLGIDDVHIGLEIIRAVLHRLRQLHALKLSHGNLGPDTISCLNDKHTAIYFLDPSLESRQGSSLTERQAQDIRAVAISFVKCLSETGAVDKNVDLFTEYEGDVETDDYIAPLQADGHSLLFLLPELNRILLCMIHDLIPLDKIIERFEEFTQSRSRERDFGNVITGINHNYECLENLHGSGGQAEVYKARRLYDGKLFALKCLKEELYHRRNSFVTLDFTRSKKKSSRERAEEEPEILKSLNHKNIVKFVDIGSDLSLGAKLKKPPQLVMEYLQGQTLATIISNKNTASRPTDEQILTYFLGFLSALDHCHKNGFIHRDIKPDNLFIKKDNTPVLLDLGIAKNNRDESTTGAIPGTPEYMAPEIVLSADRGDAQTDIFSLGLCLFESLFSRSPYRRRLPERNWESHCVRRSRWIRKKGGTWWQAPFTRRYDGIVAKLFIRSLNPNPLKRYKDVNVFHDEIVSVLKKYSANSSSLSRTNRFSTPATVTSLFPQLSYFDLSFPRRILLLLASLSIAGILLVPGVRKDLGRIARDVFVLADPWRETIEAVHGDWAKATSVPQIREYFVRYRNCEPRGSVIDELFNRPEQYRVYTSALVQAQVQSLSVDLISLRSGRDYSRKLKDYGKCYQTTRILLDTEMPDDTHRRYLVRLGKLSFEKALTAFVDRLNDGEIELEEVFSTRKTMVKSFGGKKSDIPIRMIDSVIYDLVINSSIDEVEDSDLKLLWDFILSMDKNTLAGDSDRYGSLIERICDRRLNMIRATYDNKDLPDLVGDDKMTLISGLSKLRDEILEARLSEESRRTLSRSVVNTLERIINLRSEILIDNFDSRSYTPGASSVTEISAIALPPSYAVSKRSYQQYFGEHGMAVEVTYNSNGSQCEWRLDLDDIDLRNYDFLSFWVKGDRGNEKFNIAIGSGSEDHGNQRTANAGPIALFCPGGLTNEWREAVVPLEPFTNKLDMSGVSFIHFSFDDIGNGTVFVDEMKVKRELLPIRATLPEARRVPEHPRALFVTAQNPILNRFVGDSLFSLCDRTSVETLYVNIDDASQYLDPGSRYRDMLNRFLANCADRNISVNVLFSNHYWSLRNGDQDLTESIDKFMAFNRATSAGASFDGFLINPDLSAIEEGTTDGAVARNDFLALLRRCKNIIESRPGEKINLGCTFEAALGGDLEFFRQATQLTDYAMLTDCFDTAAAIKGVSEGYVNAIGNYGKKLWIICRTGKTAATDEPAGHHTFYEDGWSGMESELEKVIRIYSHASGFGGLAIDSFTSYGRMAKERNAPQLSLRHVKADHEINRLRSVRSNGEIIVDGDLADWTNRRPDDLPVPYTVLEGHQNAAGKSDFDLKLYSQWTRETLFLGFEIIDDVVTRSGTTENPSGGDSVEVWLDLQLGEDFTESVISADDFHLIFNPGDLSTGGATTTIKVPPLTRGDYRQIKTASGKNASGYTIEVAIPIGTLYNEETINLSETRIRYSSENKRFEIEPNRTTTRAFYEGYQIGFCAVINDSDDAEGSADSVISTSREYAWGNPATFGFLEFTAAVPDERKREQSRVETTNVVP